MTTLNITEGCFVKLRNGSILGPLLMCEYDKFWIWEWVDISWSRDGKFLKNVDHPYDIIEVLPASSVPPPAARKSARIADGVTIPPGATNVSADGETVSWDEPADVVTLWGRVGYAFSLRQVSDSTHRIDLHIIDGEIVAAIPSRIKEAGQ